MYLKKTDKIIILIAVAMLVIASIGIAVWTPPSDYEEELLTEDDYQFLFLIDEEGKIKSMSMNISNASLEEKVIIRPLLHGIISWRIQRLSELKLPIFQRIIDRRLGKLNTLLEWCYR